MKRSHLLTGLALLGVAIAVAVIIQDNRAATVQPPPVKPSQAPFESYVAGSGVIEASSRNIAVATPVSGVVTDIDVQLGETVRSGQPLFHIDDRDLQAELIALNAAVKEAEAALQKPVHQQAYARHLRERDPTAISKQRMTELGDDVALAKARLAQARAQVEKTRMEIDRHTVHAPLDGTVMQLNLRPGEYVEASQSGAPTMILGDEKTLHVRVDIDQQDIWRVRPHAEALAFDPGNSTLRVPLEFDHIEPLVVPKKTLTGRSTERTDTRVLQVVYSFQRGDLPLFVGQQLDVYIKAPPASGVNAQAGG